MNLKLATQSSKARIRYPSISLLVELGCVVKSPVKIPSNAEQGF